MDRIVDLRSDTVTKPTPKMREAMMHAEVGDDCYGEDPAVNELERLAAEKVGELVSVHVIPRPHENIDTALPLGRGPKKK